jgi:hypothetical protein
MLLLGCAGVVGVTAAVLEHQILAVIVATTAVVDIAVAGIMYTHEFQ